MDMKLEKLYCALFWIQGKTTTEAPFKSMLLYCALFWIQGKTDKIPEPFS